MKLSPALASLPALMLLALGCSGPTPVFDCARAEASCGESPGAICVDGRCAVQSSDCASGYEYADNAGDLAGQCVVASEPDASVGDQDGGPDAQPSAPFTRALGAAETDAVEDLVIDAQGNIVVVGRYELAVDFGDGQKAGGQDEAFVAKYGPAGALIWVQTLTGPAQVHLDHVAADSDGNIYVVGQTGQPFMLGTTSITGPSAFLARYTAGGALSWARVIGNVYASDVVVHPSGDAVVAFSLYGADGQVDLGGGLLGTGPQCQECIVGAIARFKSADGSHVWSRDFRSQGGGDEGIGQLAIGPAGDVIVSLSLVGNIDLGGGPLLAKSGSRDPVLASFDGGSLAHRWSKRLGNGTTTDGIATLDVRDNTLAVAMTAFGTFEMGGPELGTVNVPQLGIGFYDAATGAHRTSRAYAVPLSPDGAWIRALVVAADGGLHLVGEFKKPVNWGTGELASAGSSDGLIVKLDKNGAALAASRFGGAGLDRASAVGLAGPDIVIAGELSGMVALDGTAINANDADGFIWRRLAP